MTVTTLGLFPGAKVAYDGELVEIVEISGSRATLRDAGNRYRVVTLSRLIADATEGACDSGSDRGPGVGVVLASLSAEDRRSLAERAGHVREVLTGYRSGRQDAAEPGEPRPPYAAGTSLEHRYQAKADELGVGARTLKRWVAAYRSRGEAGLVDERKFRGRGSTVDVRWIDACREVLAASVRGSTPTYSAVMVKAEILLEETYGADVVPLPSTATAYRHLKQITKGTNAFIGSAKGRRSIADRPKGTYGRLRASRPGEYVILDTQDLDVYAMEPVTLRWVPVQLTIAQDLFSRCILGLRLTPVSTKAVDVAGVLYQSVVPQEAPEDWPDEVCWPYHGVPAHLVFTEVVPGNARLAPMPACPPETIVVDRGKQYLSAHVIGVCASLGISIQPAQPRKPTDKPTVERFFRTLRESLIQYLPAYKGPGVHSRGEHVEDTAFLYLDELEEVVREWIAFVYHRTKHSGLKVPEWPRLELSPNEMYEIGVTKAGLLRVPATQDLAYDFLDTEWRAIQHYGIELDGRRYNGSGLDGYRNATSPYGGVHAGKWPIRFTPDDVRFAYFQDPADGAWHRLDWEHTAGLWTPFSREAADHARRLFGRSGHKTDQATALKGLLRRWEEGMVTDRRERRMALRISAQRAALPLDGETTAAQIAALPSVAAVTSVLDRPPTDPPVVEGDDDDIEEIHDTAGDDDFYADAFEVLE